MTTGIWLVLVFCGMLLGYLLGLLVRYASIFQSILEDGHYIAPNGRYRIVGHIEKKLTSESWQRESQ